MTSPGTTAPPAVPQPEAVRPAPPSADFTCNGSQAGATPRRIWRLRRSQYLNALAVLFKGRGAVGKADQTPKGVLSPFDYTNESDRYSTASASYTLADWELRRILNYSGETAAMLIAQLRKDPSSCLGATKRPPFADCMAQVVAERGPLLFQRPLAADEVAAYAGAATSNVATLGEDDAAALSIVALLSSPNFLFRSEVGAGASDAAGEVKLTQFEIASALAYTLTDWPPSQALYQAAVDGQLGSPAAIAGWVRQLVGPGNGKVIGFVREHFRYRELEKVFKSNRDLNAGNRGILLGDIEALVKDLASSALTKDFWRTLLTTTDGYDHAQTFQIYGLPDPKRFEQTKVALPPSERAGLLTQPAWLAAFSDDGESHPVQRGKFVSESLLCRTIPPLPIGQVPVLPNDPKLTLRDRLNIHSADPSCAACHRLMDPLGLVFEAYDQNGRVRSIDRGKPVDSTGALSGAGSSDGPLTGPVDLARKLASSPVVEECMVRHSFRFWMGREEAAWDGCTLVDAQTSYVAGGGSYVDLLAALFSSRSFVQRSTK
jgi:hypothetical protein